MWIFTITAGRTGTAWLTRLIGDNLGVEAVHEHLGLNDIGTQTPDIRAMRNFNTCGLNEFVEEFWSRKFAALPVGRDYCETNHTLAKAGLVEALAARPDAPPVTFVLLRRNWVDQILSYVVRNDFTNITIPWQWYLLPTYPRRVVEPQSLNAAGGLLGTLAWYAAEMEARQEYYRLLFSEKFRFLDGQLEEISTTSGAERFLADFGFRGTVKLPEKTNASKQRPSDKLRTQVEEFISQLRFDPVAVARQFIESGERLSAPHTT